MWNGAEFAWQSIARQPWDCARECIRDPWPSPALLPLQAHGAPGCTQNHLGPSPFSPGKWIVRSFSMRIDWISSNVSKFSDRILFTHFYQCFWNPFSAQLPNHISRLACGYLNLKRWQKSFHGLWYRSTTYHFLPAVSQAELMLVFLVVNSFLVNQLLVVVICHLVEGFWQDYSRQSTCAGRKVGLSEEKMRGQTWIQRDSCHIRPSSLVVHLR